MFHIGAVSRRGFLAAVVAVYAVLAMDARGVAAPAESTAGLSAGAAVTDITPPLDVGLLMSSGRQLWAPFERVRLPLHARAVVVEQADRRIALVSLDLIGLAGEAVGGMGRFRERVAAAAGGTVQADDFVLASTHTHTGPESIALSDLYHTEAFQQWTDHLARQIGLAIRNAAGSLQPCRLMTGGRAAPGLAANRRMKTTRGMAWAHQQLPPETVVGPEGPTDDFVRVAALVDQSNRPIAILVNFAVHPILEMCIKQASPDFPGEMCLELERRHPGSVPLFLQGACGNINPRNVEASAAHARRFGQRLAELTDEALGDLQPVKTDRLSLDWKTVKLPARSVTGEPDAQGLRTRIGALRMGDAVFVCLPGEPFIEIALAIQDASPWKFTAVLGYADDYIGYIPTDRAFRNGGYETGPGRWSRVAAGSEPIVCRSAIELIGASHGTANADRGSRP